MYDTVPNLTAAMRARCPMGMGADCACAARIEGRVAAGESEGAILAEYAPTTPPAFGPLITAILHQLTRRPTRSTLDLTHWDTPTATGPEGDMSKTKRFDLDAFLANITDTLDGGGGGFDDLPPADNTPRRTTAQPDETVLV